MPIPSGVDKKKSKVYIEKGLGTENYVQILPESFCEEGFVADSFWPVSSHFLKQYTDSVEERIAPFAGATAVMTGKIGTVPQAEPADRMSFLRGDGKWTKVTITDDKVKCILNKEKKFYLIGTEIADTNTGQTSFDTGVFVTRNPGELQATHFIGNLTGNVVGNLEGTAKRARYDANGNEISTFYAKDSQLGDYSPVGHKHSSADMNAMTGYSKGTSTAAISTDDTLNKAIGKLESRLDVSATLNSPHLSGVPTTPTPGSNSVQNQIANKEYVDSKISDLIGGAGSALDTLKEIQSALGNDPNFAATMTTKLGTKLDKTSANYVKTLSISDNTAGTGQILKVQRGDDTTYNLTIKDTVIYPATAVPKVDGTGAVGTSVKYAREDHVHPLQTIISATPAGTSWVTGVQAGKALVSATTTSYGALLNAPTKNYRVGLSTYPSSNDLVYLYSVTNANVSAGTNTTAKALTWNAATGELTANSFKGAASSCSGNSATATALATARNFYVADNSATNTGPATSFNGSANATIKLPATIKANITGNCSGSSGSCTGNAKTATTLATARKINGVAFNGSADITITTSDNTKLPLTGGTVTGATYFTTDYYRKDTGAVKGTAPSSNRWQNGVRFVDNNNVAFGGIERGYLSDRTNRINMIVYKGTDTTTSPNAQIGVGYDANGNWFTYAPTPAGDDNSTKIATTAWVQSKVGGAGGLNILPTGGWEDRSNGVTYTADSNGWVYGRNSKYKTCGTTTKLRVHGIDYWLQSCSYGSWTCANDQTIIVPVKKGQTYRAYNLDSCGFLRSY